MIAFLSSTKVAVDAQILCSLSPYIAEDIPHLKTSWIKSIGKRRVDDFKTMSIKKLCKQIQTKTFLLYGTEESQELIKRDKETFQLLECGKQLVEVLGAKHDIEYTRYFEEIKKSYHNSVENIFIVFD